MKHCILAKYRPEVYPRRQELLPRIRQIFSAASELEGVSGASVYPNCVARDNRYDVLIVLDMAPEALPVYDASAMHHLWKEEFGPLLAQKLYDEGIITDVVVENTDTFTQYEGAYVTKTERYEDLDALLETGEIDAACMDACIAQTYMNDQREFLDVSIAHQEYGVATVKDSAFSAPVAEAVQAMLDDGTIEWLIDKWN